VLCTGGVLKYLMAYV